MYIKLSILNKDDTENTHRNTQTHAYTNILLVLLESVKYDWKTHVCVFPVILFWQHLTDAIQHTYTLKHTRTHTHTRTHKHTHAHTYTHTHTTLKLS